MSLALTILQFVVSAGLLVVAALAFRDWLRQRDNVALRFQAMAIGSLAVVSGLGRLRSIFPFLPAKLVSPLSLIAFVVSGYSLWQLRAQIIPTSRFVRFSFPAVLAVAAVFSFVVTLVTGQVAGRPPAGLQWVATLAVIGAWIICVIDPAIRFWKAGSRLSAVQRARLRLLSAGYSAIAAIFVFAIFALGHLPDIGVQLTLQILVLPVIPLLWAAFSPPAWLKRLWRSSEEQSYQDAVRQMVLYSPSRQEIARRAIDWAVRFVGADSGVIVNRDNQCVASNGINNEELKHLLHVVGDSEGLVRMEGPHAAVVVPLQSESLGGRLIVLTGALTPVFAGEEVGQLQAYASVVSIALERAAISERLIALEHAKSDFLNLASHELNGPLTVLKGYFSMLATGGLDVGLDNGRLVSVLLRQVEQMGLIISQMIESARIDDDRLELHLETGDLGKIVQQVIDARLEVITDDHTIVQDNRVGALPIHADMERIRTIILNLLDNAIKYSPGGGQVTCTLDLVGDHIECSFADEGIGIRPEDARRLFTRFGRVVDPAYASIPGTGLGLYLCRELAQRHGGNVRFVPGRSKGATFVLELPIALSGQGTASVLAPEAGTVEPANLRGAGAR